MGPQDAELLPQRSKPKLMRFVHSVTSPPHPPGDQSPGYKAAPHQWGLSAGPSQHCCGARTLHVRAVGANLLPPSLVITNAVIAHPGSVTNGECVKPPGSRRSPCKTLSTLDELTLRRKAKTISPESRTDFGVHCQKIFLHVKNPRSQSTCLLELV